MIELSKVQSILDWIKQQIFLDTVAENAHKRIVKRGQVYYCNFGYGVGSEIRKRRPCVIVQNNKGNTHSGVTIVAPITHTYKDISTVVEIADKHDKDNNLILDGYVNTSEIRAVDKARLDDFVCCLSADEMLKVDKAIAISINIYNHYEALQTKYNDRMLYIKKLNELLNDIKEIAGTTDNKKIVENLRKMLDKSEK